ncbi:hypothetical protein ACHAXR_009731 [Thalassiosira sp. AJA248-18]
MTFSLSMVILVLFSFVAVASGGSIYDDAAYQTVQFTPNVTHRSNLCDRQNLLRSGDIDFLDVLRGLNLSVGLLYLPGLDYVTYDEEAGTFSGYWIEILDELADRVGFSWQESWGLILSPSVEGAFRLNPNATFDDLLSWAAYAYDFSFAEWDRTIERMQLGLDFPAGFSDSSTILIGRNTNDDEPSFRVFSFMQPFDWTVWVSILATTIFTGLAYKLVSKTYYIGQTTMQPQDENVSEHVAGVNIYYAALTATGHNEFSPVTLGERILVLSLCFWSLVIAATYTANLASVMISKNQPIYLATSITEAQSKGVSICASKGFSAAVKLRRKYPNLKLVESDGLNGKYEDLLANKCGLVAESASQFELIKLNSTLNGDCSLEWVGRAVDIGSAGPVNIVDAGSYCTSLVGHVFEYYLKEMERDGFIEKTIQSYVNSITTHTCPEEEVSSDVEESFRLSMVDMGGVFLCHGVACVLGLLVSFMQRYWNSKTDSGTMHQNETSAAQSPKDDGTESGNGDGILSAVKIGSGEY